MARKKRPLELGAPSSDEDVPSKSRTCCSTTQRTSSTTLLLLTCCLTISTAYAYVPTTASPLFSGKASSMTRRHSSSTIGSSESASYLENNDDKVPKSPTKKVVDFDFSKYFKSEKQRQAEQDKESWWQWTKSGRRVQKKKSDLAFQEAEELGGLKRTDRYSSRDWFHNTLSLPSSRILRSIRSPVVCLTAWSFAIAFIHGKLLQTNPTMAKHICLSPMPHQLMVSALSLLLVFKTNSAYQRFAEGRKIWEGIINHSRDLYRMMNLYENQIGKAKRRRLQKLLAAFPYLLRHRIRPNLVMYRLDDEENIRDPEHSLILYQDKAQSDLDPEYAKLATQEENQGKSRRKTRQLYWVDKRTLPWRLLPPNALEQCARAQNRPLWVCDRMAQELRNVPDDGTNFSARERLSLIAKVDKLSACIGACERIHQTAVPLNYARHSLRALTLWLLTLPFALVNQLHLTTGPAVFLISWLLFGVYEIGYSIEDPFQGTLRLSILCDTIRRDVLADEMVRGTAFQFDDESLATIDSTSSSSSPSDASSVFSSKPPPKEGDADDDETLEYESDHMYVVENDSDDSSSLSPPTTQDDILANIPPHQPNNNITEVLGVSMIEFDAGEPSTKNGSSNRKMP